MLMPDTSNVSGSAGGLTVFTMSVMFPDRAYGYRYGPGRLASEIHGAAGDPAFAVIGLSLATPWEDTAERAKKSPSTIKAAKRIAMTAATTIAVRLDGSIH